MSYVGLPLPLPASDRDDPYEVLPGLYRAALAAARDAARRNRESFETWLTRAIIDALQREVTAPAPPVAATTVDPADLLQRLDRLATEVAELRQRLGTLEAPPLPLLRSGLPRPRTEPPSPRRKPLRELLYGAE
jgi:hypothetical protein